MVRSSHYHDDQKFSQAAVLPHNNSIDSKNSIENILNSGSMATRGRGAAVKLLKRKVSITNDGALINQISLDILMDQTSDTVAHKQSVRNLLKLAGLGDDIEIGDPNND